MSFGGFQALGVRGPGAAWGSLGQPGAAWGSLGRPGAAWGGETPSPIQRVYSLLDAWALQVGCLGIGHLEASMI